MYELNSNKNSVKDEVPFNIKGKKVIKITIFIVSLGIFFGAGFFVGKNQVVCKVCKPETLDFSLFWDAYDKLHESFINPEEINDQKVIYGAISGMTENLGDPYTDFFDPEQAKMFNQDLEGSFEGVGIEVGVRKDQLTVIAPLKGTPGERAGLKPGDILVKINDQATSNISIDQAINMIRGEKGTEVTLTIFREGWQDSKDIKIVRDVIKVNAVEWELKDGNVAYIQIHQFNQPLSSDFKKISIEILSSPAEKIILDLRNNPGGYLEISQEIAGWFLKPGEIVTIEDFGSKKDQNFYKSEGNARFLSYPIVVLINNGSASASEILAGALRDNRQVQLIGEKSFGKGSVQELISLSDNASFLKVTIAKWLTPKGNSISEVGLEPDIKVESNDEDDLNSENDIQLEKALEIIKGL